MKPTIITIAGTLGSGKSSTARGVAEILGYRHFSSGDLFRAIGKERGLSIEEINKTAELEQEIDRAVDKRLQDMAHDTNLVIDSRLAFHWMPDSFKVFLDLAPEIAATRIFKQIQSEGRHSEWGASVAEVLESIKNRRESEKKRYGALYHIDITDISPFDLVVDTSKYDLAGVIGHILKTYRARD